MASVFLSYDHDDATRAAPIASALEKAGHLVWWDRHIHGGAEYNSAIEGAVESADVVVVLWSERSVRSAWVRDEAAEGRDRGRLVPASLDQARPPMGFRQYQTIDLSQWKGRRAPPELLHAIQAVAGSASDAKPAATSPTTQRKGRGVQFAVLASAVAIIALIVAGLLLWRPWSSNRTAVVAINAADSSPESQDFATNLLTQLGQLQSAKPDTLQLVGRDAVKRAALVFEVAAATEGQQARVNLVLLDGRTRALFWSRPFERSLQEIGDLRQELGYTAAQVLECAVEAHPRGRAALKADTLKLYLNGCAGLPDSSDEAAPQLVPVFRKVLEAAPRFEGAWSKLLLVEIAAVEFGQDDPGPAVTQLKRQLMDDLAEAKKVNPHLPAAYSVEMVLLVPRDAYQKLLETADRGIAHNPDNSLLLSERGRILFATGRVDEALADARRAVEANPISPEARSKYIYALGAAGQKDAAFNELTKAERLWPGSAQVRGMRFTLNLRYGDPKVAWEMIRSGQVNTEWRNAKSYLDARLNPTEPNIKRAVQDAYAAYRRIPYTLYHLMIVLSEFGREDELLELMMRVPRDDAVSERDILFRPTAREFWRKPKSLDYARRIGLLQYWQSSGKWPDFCFAPDLPYDCKKETAKLLGATSSR